MTGDVQPLIKVDRTDKCLQRLSQQTASQAAPGFDLAAAEVEQIAQSKATSHASERRSPHQRRPERGKHALRSIGEPGEEIIGDDQPKDCVAEVLQTLVRSEVKLGVLVEVRAMNQRLLEEGRILEVDPNQLLCAADDVDRTSSAILPRRGRSASRCVLRSRGSWRARP